MIRVRATATGYYGRIRERGDEFDIADERAFSHRWMVRLDRVPRAKGGAPRSQDSTPEPLA